MKNRKVDKWNVFQCYVLFCTCLSYTQKLQTSKNRLLFSPTFCSKDSMIHRRRMLDLDISLLQRRVRVTNRT